MMGNPGAYGVIPRAIEQVFAYISEVRFFLIRGPSPQLLTTLAVSIIPDP